MADRELVIKIPEETYNRILERNRIHTFDNEVVCDAIKEGTLLPKGHGDLIDKSLLYPDSDYDDGLFYAVSIGQINGTATIIKADTESEDKE